MISKKVAIKLMIGLLSFVLVFHFGVLCEIISYKIVWAGKLSSLEEMRVFETASILINTLLIAVLYIKSKNIKRGVPNKAVNIIIWVFVFLFAINTIGNLWAKNVIEQTLGTALTLVSSILCWIIVRKNE